MIREKIKNQQGISLVALTITVIVLIILTNVIVYTVKDNLQIEKLKNLQNDIDNLRNKVASYYAQNGAIPASIKYTNESAINNMKSEEFGVISDAVDTGDFYIIDLAALENLTLHYGEEFEEVKKLEGLTEEEKESKASEYTDLYIINEDSHNIFYAAGINIDGEWFYTDYTKEEVDESPIKLRYIYGVNIPEGFYYSGKDDEGNITITSDDDTKKYRWIQQNEEIEEVPEGIVLEEDSQTESEFIESVNVYKGYYQNTSDTSNVYYLVLEEKWSPVYKETGGTFKDKNGDTAYIPLGFRVSEKPGETTITEGLVVQAPDGSEFVWVPVPTVVSDTEANGTTNKAMAVNIGTEEEPQYRGLLYDFTETSSEVRSGCTGETTSNREPANLEDYDNNTNIPEWEEDTYQNEYNSMIESVKKYGGFYVGRYETSINEETGAVQSKSTTPMTAATENQAWYGMYDKQKKYATSNEELKDVATSSMIWGSQYDAMMNWMLTSKVEKSKVAANSTRHDLTITGGTPDDKMNNIYDLGNNLSEWTLEAVSTKYRVIRGGYYRQSYAPSYRRNDTKPESGTYDTHYTSRITLYMK